MKFEPAGITDDPELRIATSLHRLHLPPAGARLPLRWRSAPSSASSPRRSGRSRRCPGVEEMATPSVGLVEDGLERRRGGGLRAGAIGAGGRGRWPGPSSATRRSVTTAATPCSGPARATCAGAAGRPAGARSQGPTLLSLRRCEVGRSAIVGAGECPARPQLLRTNWYLKGAEAGVNVDVRWPEVTMTFVPPAPTSTVEGSEEDLLLRAIGRTMLAKLGCRPAAPMLTQERPVDVVTVTA